MKKITTNHNNKTHEENKQKTVKSDRYELPQLLISLTDEKGASRFSDEQLDRRKQIIELIGGGIVDLNQLKVNDAPGKYFPMFTNEKPFFKLMYKLNGWSHLDHTNFNKPSCVSLWIKKYIYARFGANVLPSLLDKDNPVTYGHVRKYKLFQYFNDKGLIMLEMVIKQAIAVMEQSENWYDFELKYTKEYKLPVQLRLFRD